MNTEKYLGEWIDAPRSESDGKRQTLPRPEPGLFEYRIYFGYHTKLINVGEEDDEQVEEPAARFISCVRKNEPTNEEWTAMLLENGYTKEQIKDIME